MNLFDIDVLILCGGRGERLRGVLPEGIPKAMAGIDGEPFIYILITNLFFSGFSRAILAVGYGIQHLRDYYSTRAYLFDGSALIPYEPVKFSEESEPLGTGGAIVNALPQIESDLFFVINGDTLCELDYADILKNHIKTGFDVTVPYDDQYRNVGTYLLSKKAIKAVADELGPKWDLDEAFTIWPKKKILVNWYPVDVKYWDIGESPEALENFRQFWKEKNDLRN